MAVVLLILKIIGFVLLGAVAIILAVLFIPAMVTVKYAGNDLDVRLRVLYFIKIRIPLSGKSKNKPAKDETQPPADNAPKKKSSEKLELSLIKQLLPPAKTLFARVCRAITICRVKAYCPVSDSDPAKTALKYGRTCAELGAAYALLSEVFNVRVDNIEIVPDFEREHKGEGSFYCEIHALLIMIVSAAIAFLIKFLKLKSNKSVERQPDVKRN